MSTSHYPPIPAPAARWRAALALAGYAGLRLGEVRGLRWADVDLEGDTISVSRSLLPDGSAKAPKTEAGTRTVPMLPALRRLLVEWKLRSHWTAPEDYVLCAHGGAPVQQRNAQRALENAKKAAGLDGTEERLSWHSLRHSFASMLATDLELPATTLARIVGHADAGFSLRVYAKDARDESAVVSDVLARSALSLRPTLVLPAHRLSFGGERYACPGPVRRWDWLTRMVRWGILALYTGSREGEMQMTKILRRAFTAVMSFLLVALVAAFAMPAAAAPAEVIVLPGATSAEGIANGGGTTFYAGDLFAGDIFRGDVQRGTAQLFIDAPAGRMAVGMVVDLEHDLLFVAGGFTGQGYVYDTRTGATVAIYQFGAADTSLINDVALTKDGAWFTDSFRSRLYFVPVNEAGVPGSFLTLQLTGPAAVLSGQFNLNGIQATPNGKTLIVAHSTNGQLYTVDPVSGASATIADVSVPSVDGIVLLGRRLWAVQNTNQVTRVQLSPHLTSGVVEEVITSELFQVPATGARFGSRLAVVNAKFDTGFPPRATTWEVVLVDR